MTVKVCQIDVRDPMFEPVGRLRYTVYAEEEGQDLPGMDHARRVFVDPLDELSIVFAAVEDGGVIGTLRITPMQALPAGGDARACFETQQWPVPETRQLLVGRLMVDARHRGGDACARLFAAGYQSTLAHGYEVAFLACNPRNAALYESVGCRQISPLISDPTYGLDVPLALIVRDIAHLERVQSPLRRLAGATPANDTLAEWVADAVGPRGGPLSVRMKDDVAQQALFRTLACLPAPPFSELTLGELRQALRTATVLDVPAGMTVLRPGCVCTETFLVLEGAVSSTSGGEAMQRVISPGQIFNEGALLGRPRSKAVHTVVTTAPTRLLALSAESFMALRAKCASVARSIEFGLRRLVVERDDAC